MRPTYSQSLAATSRSSRVLLLLRSRPVTGQSCRGCCLDHRKIIASPTVRHASQAISARLPFRFDTGIALFAKRTPRPFPPPFNSPPSASFSDPLSTHNLSRDRRAFVGGELVKGQTNGDDAVYASDYFICANDGVGAWAARPRGHAGYVGSGGRTCWVPAAATLMLTAVQIVVKVDNTLLGDGHRRHCYEIRHSGRAP